MFKPHEKAVTPPRDSVIWRYVDLAKFISMLDSRSLYFSSIAVLAKVDQWEAVFRRPLKEIWQEQTGANLDRSSQYLREHAFVNCWHMNDHESDAMWKLYAYGGNNLAIKSTVGKLCDTFGSRAESVHIGEVEYLDDGSHDYSKLIDSGPNAKVLNITPVLLWKRPSFAHEKELRAFTYTGPLIKGPHTPGMPIFVDLNLLFDEVRVSPRAPAWFRDLIQSVMTKYGFEHVPVNRSNMDDEPEPT